MKKSILAVFDIDGTIFKGPPSFLALLKFKFSGSKLYNSNIEPDPVSPLARKIDKLDDYGVFPSVFVQKPKKNIVKLIKSLNKQNISLNILSGRGKKLLQKITLIQLKKHHLLQYFDKIFLKPGNFKSSTTWKFHALKEFTQSYKKVYLFENDLTTSLKIGHFAQTNNLPIYIILVPSLETHPFIFRVLNIKSTLLKNNNIKLFKSSLKF
jgi:hypothetical protein